MSNQGSHISSGMRQLHEEAEIIPFRQAPITGAKEPPIDWLSELPVGVTFLARTKNFTPVFDEYTIKGRGKTGATLLRENRKEGKEDVSQWNWFDPLVFCKQHDLVEVL